VVARTNAAGKIPGGDFKREGRPTESEILNSRIIDRPIRPHFPEGCRNETQVVATVLSMDRENDPDTLGVIGASAALMLSDIPWDGPVAAVRVGRRNGEFIINPLPPIDDLDLNLIVAVGREGIVMVEGEASFLPESVLLDALMFAQEQATPLLDLQEEMAKEMGINKRAIELPKVDQERQSLVEKKVSADLKKALTIKVKKVRGNTIRKLLTTLNEELAADYPDRKSDIDG